MLCPLPSLLSGEPFLELGPCSQELGSLCVLPHQPSSQLSSLDSPGGPLRTLNAATVGASCPGCVRPRDVDGSLDAAFACHAAFQTRDGGPAPQGQLSVQVLLSFFGCESRSAPKQEVPDEICVKKNLTTSKTSTFLSSREEQRSRRKGRERPWTPAPSSEFTASWLLAHKLQPPVSKAGSRRSSP